MTATQDWQTRWDAALMGNYGTPSVALTRGECATVRAVDGTETIALFAGLAVNALGPAHPAVHAAGTNQQGRPGRPYQA